MDLTFITSLFGTHFESIQLDGKLPSKMGFDGICKLHAYEIESRNETEYQYPEWTSYASPLILAHISNPSDSVLNFPPKWILTGTLSSILTKSSDKMKLSAKHNDWTSHAPNCSLH